MATDLDGTFLSPDGTVSAENARAVADAMAAGLLVVFATGRPPRWLSVLAELPVSHPIVVASNGALLWDLGDERALHSHPIDRRVARRAIRDLRAALPEVSFGFEQGMRFGAEPAYRIGWQPASELGDPRFFTGDAEELSAEPFVKLLIQHPALGSAELAARAAEVVGGALTLTWSSFSELPGLLEASAPGVTKARTLAAYAAELGVARGEVAAFGDMPNDRAMLEWAGQAYLMAQSHASLADLSATVIGSNAESAVGRTIRAWL
ncbi:HAD family phosphatase [Naumannella sp. ID2617S]|nr:HAD family phosphatase [Naumannella sp. ID2617S]